MLARTLALAALPLLAACGAADPNEVLDTVRATEQAQLQAIASKDLRGATRNYDSAAVVVVPGGAPIAGTPAIEQAFEAQLADRNFKLTMEPGAGWASESGELAVTTATGSVTATDPANGEAVTIPIANQTVWHREDGVGWKIVSEHNAPLPPPAQAPDG